MKKYVAILLGLTMVLGLCACGTKAGDNKETKKDTSKKEMVISTSDALKSDGFEFIYNLSEIPDSFWTDENALTYKTNYEEKMYSLDMNIAPADFDFVADIVTPNYETEDHEDCVYYELSFKNNDHFIIKNLEPLVKDDGYICGYVLGNDMDFYYASIDLEFANGSNNFGFDSELKENEWNIVKYDSDDYMNIYGFYMFNENIGLKFAMESISKTRENTYTEKQLEEMCKYFVSLMEIKKVEVKKAASVKIITDDVKLADSVYFAFNHNVQLFCEGEEDIKGCTFVDFYNETGYSKRFIEFDSEESLNRWKTSSETEEKYNDEITVLKSNSGYSTGDYSGIIMKYGEKYYALYTFSYVDSSKVTVDDYVKGMLKNVIIEKQ